MKKERSLEETIENLEKQTRAPVAIVIAAIIVLSTFTQEMALLRVFYTAIALGAIYEIAYNYLFYLRCCATDRDSDANRQVPSAVLFIGASIAFVWILPAQLLLILALETCLSEFFGYAASTLSAAANGEKLPRTTGKPHLDKTPIGYRMGYIMPLFGLGIILGCAIVDRGLLGDASFANALVFGALALTGSLVQLGEKVSLGLRQSLGCESSGSLIMSPILGSIELFLLKHRMHGLLHVVDGPAAVLTVVGVLWIFGQMFS